MSIIIELFQSVTSLQTFAPGMTNISHSATPGDCLANSSCTGLISRQKQSQIAAGVSRISTQLYAAVCWRGPAQFNRSKRIAGNDMTDIMVDITRRDGGHSAGEGELPRGLIAPIPRSFPPNRHPAEIMIK